MTEYEERLALRDDVEVRCAANRELSIEGRWLRLTVGQPSADVRGAFLELAKAPSSERSLVDALRARGVVESIPELLALLRRLDEAAVLGRTVCGDSVPIASVHPVLPLRFPAERPLDPRRIFRFSRLTYWRQRGDDLVVESPLGHGRLLLHSESGTALARLLALGESVENIVRIARVSRVLCEQFVRLAMIARLLADDEPPEAAQWEFADLLLHSRCRLGRHSGPYGATYRFKDVSEPAPALKPPQSDHVLDLPAPPDSLAVNFLEEVMRRRRSVRRYGKNPITEAQLAELLFRSQRHHRTISTAMGELGSRPYPSGGALYELEVFPLVNRCAGLDAGFYRYIADAHQVEVVSGRDSAVEQLLSNAAYALAEGSAPDVLLVISARFARVSWKYQAIAYSLVLKHVGVLYQTLYLVATDMGLAACALGGGDSELFAEAAQLNYLVEGSVGEFALGSRPDSS